MEEPETSVKNRSPMTIIENGGRTEKSQKSFKGRDRHKRSSEECMKSYSPIKLVLNL
jgi:hypothetical protein